MKDGDRTEKYHYVFGFGSIINSSTHAPWLATESKSDDKECETALSGQRSTILSSFGYRRGWNFRSATGFTALGITNVGSATDINGVLFRITGDMLSGFNRREVGYDRVEIPIEHLKLFDAPDTSKKSDTKSEKAHHCFVKLDIKPDEKIWVSAPRWKGIDQRFTHLFLGLRAATSLSCRG
jgi:hypothetical protein